MQFIVRSISEGVPIGVDPTASFVLARRNMSSALENPQVIEDFLSKRSQLGTYFNARVDALELNKGFDIRIYHYLNDFIVLGSPGTEKWGAYLSTLQQVCQELGVPLAPEKQDSPAEVLTLLGIEIDIIRQELRLP